MKKKKKKKKRGRPKAVPSARRDSGIINGYDQDLAATTTTDFRRWWSQKEIAVFSPKFFQMQPPQQGTAQMRVLGQNVASISKEYPSKYKSSVFCPHWSLEKKLSLSTNRYSQSEIDGHPGVRLHPHWDAVCVSVEECVEIRRLRDQKKEKKKKRGRPKAEPSARRESWALIQWENERHEPISSYEHDLQVLLN